MSRTYLLFGTNEQENILLGYFSIALNIFHFSNLALSKSKVKKFTGFPADTDKEEIAVYLIGQLAKNDKYANQISGKDLLDSAFLKIRKSQDIAGGRCTMVESKNLSKLEDFYIENGFSKVREDTDFLLQFMRIIG